MKILCLSDTHYEREALENITNRYLNYELFIHCGDSDLKKDDPLLIKYHVVRGNHDVVNFDLEKQLIINHKKILIVHGHLYDLYHSYDQLKNYMIDQNIDICFHGHTHIPALIHFDNRIIINPGSTLINRATYGFGTYACIELTQNIEVKFYHATKHYECTKLVLEDGESMLQQFYNLK